MAAINPERFVALVTDTNPDRALKTSNIIREVALTTSRVSYDEMCAKYYTAGGGYRMLPAVDREAALAMLDTAKAYLVSHGYFSGKGIRPWEIDDELYSTLDRSEPWWGFEFETGYRTAAGRAEVLSDVWDRWHNVAFDGEGEGDFISEITFAPQERSKYLDGTAQAVEFMQYLDGAQHLVHRTGYSDVGTHFNMSHPKLDTHGKVAAMAKVLNNTLHLLPNSGARSDLFGRSELYGGFFTNASQDAQAHWLEGKLFRTTYEADVFAEYLIVCDAIQTCVEAVLVLWEEDAINNKMAISNLEEVVGGKAPVIVYDQAFIGTPYGDWINNYHSLITTSWVNPFEDISDECDSSEDEEAAATAWYL